MRWSDTQCACEYDDILPCFTTPENVLRRLHFSRKTQLVAFSGSYLQLTRLSVRQLLTDDSLSSLKFRKQIDSSKP